MTKTSIPNQATPVSELKEIDKEVHMPDGCCSGAIVSFSGLLNTESHNSLIALSKNAIHQCSLPRAEMNKVGLIVDDCLKNTLNYGWIDPNGEILIYFIVNCIERGLRCSCRYFMGSHMTEDLEQKLNDINSKSESELRKRSIELICDREKHNSTGSESNLINLAQNCTSAIEFRSVTHNEGRDMFTLIVELTK
jgi:hypothetical protein